MKSAESNPIKRAAPPHISSLVESQRLGNRQQVEMSNTYIEKRVTKTSPVWAYKTVFLMDTPGLLTLYIGHERLRFKRAFLPDEKVKTGIKVLGRTVRFLWNNNEDVECGSWPGSSTPLCKKETRRITQRRCSYYENPRIIHIVSKSIFIAQRRSVETCLVGVPSRKYFDWWFGPIFFYKKLIIGTICRRANQAMGITKTKLARN